MCFLNGIEGRPRCWPKVKKRAEEKAGISRPPRQANTDREGSYYRWYPWRLDANKTTFLCQTLRDSDLKFKGGKKAKGFYFRVTGGNRYLT